jgi:prepilin-type processing-associated H-X9-DG protein
VTCYYTHTAVPNYKGRDCIRDVGYDRGHMAARSYHTSGVNVLFADGSIRFITNGITLAAWRALGTRSGGEAVDSGS